MSFGITHFCCSKKKVGKVCGPIDKFLTPLCSTSVSGRMDDGYWFILSICATVNTAHCSICIPILGPTNRYGNKKRGCGLVA
jgi:hypothetical protein